MIERSRCLRVFPEFPEFAAAAERGNFVPVCAERLADLLTPVGAYLRVVGRLRRPFLLESAAGDDGRVAPFAGETRLFITPGYRFKAVDGLITNFHTPRSTLFMLVCALAGTARMKAGVWIAPWMVSMRPVRALPSVAARVKENLLMGRALG